MTNLIESLNRWSIMGSCPSSRGRCAAGFRAATSPSEAPSTPWSTSSCTPTTSSRLSDPRCRSTCGGRDTSPPSRWFRLVSDSRLLGSLYYSVFQRVQLVRTKGPGSIPSWMCFISFFLQKIVRNSAPVWSKWTVFEFWIPSLLLSLPLARFPSTSTDRYGNEKAVPE